MEKEEKGFENLSDILSRRMSKKPTAYPWQDLALRIIRELKIPNFKRNSVFKVCKTCSRQRIENALTDTKELCNRGEKWKYFFKIIEQDESQIWVRKKY